MIRSMTAFATAEKTEDDFSITVEIRSYNSRYLDIVLRLPHGYLNLEEKIKQRISGRVARGRIEVKIQIRDASEDAHTFEIDMSRARAYHGVLHQLKKEFQIDGRDSLELLLGVGGIIKPAEVETDMERCLRVVRDCLDEAMDDLVDMREREGDFIARDFAERLDFIETRIDQIETASHGLLQQYQERLKERIQALTDGVVEIEPARIAQEAAFLSEKSDISEEIVRAKSHIKQFETIMNSEDASGRKLNFLVQELNREFNTMGSKTEDANVSHTVVDIKSELEKIREQIQNVE
ncbi:MAG: YicC family protein [Deltaproteobacteria bacterium]|nr:YicC family protein [Deltaproteobacteria bacterium]